MTIPKQEAKLKGKLLEHLRVALPRLLVFPLADASSGLPDWLIAGNGVMSMLEFKHATPAFYSRGIQVLTARRIAVATGRCRYVVFREKDELKMTYIVHPLDVDIGRNTAIHPESAEEGFDFDFVIDYVRRVHRCQ